MQDPSLSLRHLKTSQGFSSWQPKRLMLTLACWALPLAWVAPPALPFSSQKTRLALKEGQSVVAAYKSSLHALPASLADVRTFARAHKLAFSTYDGYGNRLDYTRLDPEHYVLRSFGSDGEQGSLLDPHHEVVAALATLPPEGLVHLYVDPTHLHVYPPSLLLGVDAPSRQWFLRLYTDKESGRRRLVAVHRHKDRMVMLASHDRVEEFFWLPTGYQVIYSATGSTREPDGLFLWNLLDDSQVNLLQLAQDKAKGLLGTLAHSQDYWISLAGISLDGPTVYAYVAAREGSALDPMAFYAPGHLLAFRLGLEGADGKTLKSIQVTSFGMINPSPTFTGRPAELNSSLLTLAQLENPDRGTFMQKRWLSLPVSGSIDQVLTPWQEFMQGEADTPVFPYGLWYLSSMYAAAAHTRPERDAQILRSYGTELARGLAGLTRAPTYLQAFGVYTFRLLLDGKDLPYTLAHFVQPSDQAAPAPPPLPPKTQP